MGWQLVVAVVLVLAYPVVLSSSVRMDCACHQMQLPAEHRIEPQRTDSHSAQVPGAKSVGLWSDFGRP